MPIEIERRGRKKKKRDTEKAIAKWKIHLSLGEKRLKDAGGDIRGKGEWKEHIDFFKGNQWSPGQGGEEKTFHRITSNLVKSNIDSLRPQLYFQNPKVKITVKNPEILKEPQVDRDGNLLMPGTAVARIGGELVNVNVQIDLIEAIDNYYLGEMGVKKVMRRLINDALTMPYGVGKIEWWVQTRQQELVLERNEETGEATKIEMREVVVWQKPIFTRIKPWLFLWDEDLDEFDLSQAKWVAEIKYQTLEELEDDPYLKNLKDLGSPKFSPKGDYNPEDLGPGDERKDDRFRVYYIHDLMEEEFIVWVEGSEKFQRRESHPYADIENSIFIVLGFDEIPDSAFPLPLPRQIRSKIEVRNWILSAMANHIARFNRKYKILEGGMTPSEKSKLEEGADGAIIEVTTMNAGPDPIKDAPLSVDLYSLADILKREVTEDVGVTAMNRGTREPGVETAFEASKIQSGADVKTEEKRDIVHDFMVDLVKKLNQILKVFVDEPIAQEIVGSTGSSWVNWTRSDIQGEFIEDVDIYSGMPFSVLEDRRQALEMFALVAADPGFDGNEVRQELRKRMGWPEKVIRQPDRPAQEDDPAIQQLLEQSRKGQSTTMRPGGGGESAKRGPDILAGLIGPARGGP